ncbi:MCE family protein [Acidiferrimicrobium sp. IK]|uniref:MCE family protein n=1 Tax=Acidiferrimicrobium sp. IK TaxID=2871700 RepID=UPI0021CB1AE0|nr:MCE family protein [Acidiferrimicrobium sp. IK]MCU4184182.1 MCE family protein [Acidiferrimicrobium sp. IK]
MNPPLRPAAAARRARIPAVVAAAAVLVSGCGLSFQSLPQLGSVSGSGYPIYATFSNVQNLAPNAQVRLGDAVVGHVTAIKAHDFKAHLTLRIAPGTTLSAGTTAQVRFASPLGDEYVALTPPATETKAVLTPGTTLGEESTSAAPTVADTLAALGAVLYGSGLGQAHDVVKDVNQILGGNHVQIQQLIANLDTVLGSLAGNDTHLDAALDAARSIVTELNNGTGAITTALQTLPPAAAAVSADNSQLQQLLQGINSLSPVVVNVLAESGQQLADDVRQAVPVLQSLQSAQNEFGTDSSLFTQVAKAVERDAPNGYVQLNVNFTGTFPSAEPIPALAPILGCTAPTPPSECPPGSAIGSILGASLP